MKKMLLIMCLGLVLTSCGDNDAPAEETDLNAATNFIQSALKGDFRSAEKYMVDDSLNKQDLWSTARLNERLTKEEKEAYKSASIHIHETRKLNDSATIIAYSNSYRNKVDSLKVVKLNGRWLVDFKYIFNHKIDSLK